MVWHLQWKMVYQTNGYKWDFPINHGRPPSDVRGCRFTCAGGVSSREQFVSGALSVIPSTTRVLYLYDVVLDLPEKWVFQTSSSFQTRILCGWSFFFFDDCWILTGQLWDVGWLWWLNWKSHTMPTIPWVSSEFLQVYHHFREFRYSLFQESVAAESNSSDIFHESCSVWFFHVFSMTRTAPFFSPWLFWWPSLRFRAPILMEVSWVMGVAPNHPSHSTISVLKPMVTWGSSILWNPYICIIYYNIL